MVQCRAVSFYAAKHFSASATGSRRVAVECEQCRARFAYDLTRTGTGTASAPYYVGQGAAKARADRRANDDLDRRLSREAELVPCPRCHWVNQELVDRYRRGLLRGAPMLSFGLVVVAALAAVALWANDVGTERSAAIAAAAGLPLAVVPLVVRRIVRGRIDPNATFPRRPVLPPGTPPALVEQPARPGAAPQYVPSAEVYDIPAGGGAWVTFQAGRLNLPPVCCACLAPTTKIFVSPMPVNEAGNMPVPLCNSCRSDWRRRVWLTLIGCAAVGAACGAVAGMVADAVAASESAGPDPILHWSLFGVALVIGTAAGFWLAAVRSRPYRIRTLDRNRSIFQFAGKNPAYTDLLLTKRPPPLPRGPVASRPV